MKCEKCGGLMIQRYKREIDGRATVRTRECKNCKHRIKTIEISKPNYDSTVKSMNLIIEIIQKYQV